MGVHFFAYRNGVQIPISLEMNIYKKFSSHRNSIFIFRNGPIYAPPPFSSPLLREGWRDPSSSPAPPKGGGGGRPHQPAQSLRRGENETRKYGGAAEEKAAFDVPPSQPCAYVHVNQIPHQGAGGPTQTKPNPHITYVCTVRFEAGGGSSHPSTPRVSCAYASHGTRNPGCCASLHWDSRLPRLVGMGSGTVELTHTFF